MTRNIRILDSIKSILSKWNSEYDYISKEFSENKQPSDEDLKKIEEYKISQLKFDYAFMYFDTLRNLFNELVIKLKQKQGPELSNIDISFGWYMERSEILGGERP